MYRIKVKNLETGAQWKEYGFGGFMAKRIEFLTNSTNADFFKTYEIIEIVKLGFSFELLWACLLNKTVQM